LLPSELLPLSPRDFILMLILAEGPAHGYGIVKEARERFGKEVSLDPANLYRAILRLMRDGAVRDATKPPSDASEQRRYFELTVFGKEVLTAEAERLATLTDAARGLALIPKRSV
jgi:DNA-binding PadR family transcriptional regulator